MRITIKNISPLFPNGYTDVIITDEQVMKTGLHEEIILTEAKHRLMVNNRIQGIEQPIVALVYDKYKIGFIVKSTYTVDMIKHGEVVLNDDNGKSIYHAVVLDVARTQINGRFWMVEVEFYDINPDNYPGGVIEPIHYLESNFVLNKYGFNATALLQVWDVTQTPQPFYRIHTILVPDRTTDEPQADSVTTAEGIDLRTAVINKQFIEAIFFVDNDTKQNVLSILPFAGGHKVRATLSIDMENFQLMETPTYEVQKLSAGDLWQIKIKFAYNIRKHFEYA